MDIRTELGRRILFCDGAMGTMLQAAGLPAGREPELWNLERPEVVRALHGQYLAAGADIIATNTFGANGVKLSGHPLEEIVAAAVRLAREAVEEAGRGWVALDVGPTGRLLQPMGDLPFEAAVEAYAREIRAGVQAGADLVFLETMSDLYEAKAAVVAAKENSDLPIFVTLVLDEKGRLLTGGDIPSAVTLLEGLRVDALGLNCGLGPDQMAELLPTLRAYTRLPIILNPNAGLPECVDGCTRFGVAGPGRRLGGGRVLRHHPRPHCSRRTGLLRHHAAPPVRGAADPGLLLRPDRTVRRRPGAHRRAHQPHR